MRPILIALPLLALATPAASQTAPYRALGTEPFWALTIGARTMKLEEAGKPPFVVTRPVARPSFNGERYVGRQMTVDVTRARCNDGMSDRTYRDTVTVRVGRRTLKGCGGVVAERSRLADTRWTVWKVNGRQLRTPRPLTLAFKADGRVDGKFCNAFGGRYELTGERLRTHDVVGTQMACRNPSMTAETTLFRMWRASARATFSRWGTLTLDDGHDMIMLRPAR